MSLSAQKLMEQAGATVQWYLGDAVRLIDQQFHDGYAEEHPELVGQFLTACSIDCVGMVMASALEEFRLNVDTEVAGEMVGKAIIAAGEDISRSIDSLDSR
jgi:hypothetical protein